MTARILELSVWKPLIRLVRYAEQKMPDEVAPATQPPSDDPDVLFLQFLQRMRKDCDMIADMYEQVGLFEDSATFFNMASQCVMSHERYAMMVRKSRMG